MDKEAREHLRQMGRDYWAEMPEDARETRRKNLSNRMKAWWARMSPEEREARLTLRREAWRRRHPERAAAFDQAMLAPLPCHTCGATTAWPVFERMPSCKIMGWRCKEHWPAKDKEKPPLAHDTSGGSTPQVPANP